MKYGVLLHIPAIHNNRAFDGTLIIAALKPAFKLDHFQILDHLTFLSFLDGFQILSSHNKWYQMLITEHQNDTEILAAALCNRYKTIWKFKNWTNKIRSDFFDFFRPPVDTS